MRFRKPTVEPLEINLTPMIDCLLFLIVFLLLATSFNHFSRLNIILPEAEGVALTEQKEYRSGRTRRRQLFGQWYYAG